MKIQLTPAPFDPWSEIARHQSETRALAGRFGATTIFVGTMRDFNQGQSVQAMTLEHYPTMTQNYLERVAQDAASRWPIEDVLVIHRYGDLKPDDPIVLVAVWAAHRDAAFAACRHVIDELKTRAPFWKQERTDHGRHWVVPEVSK